MDSLIILPLIAVILIFTRPFKNKKGRLELFAKTFLLIEFLFSLFLLIFNLFKGEAYYKEITFFGTDWIAPMGFKMVFGADLNALVLIVLTTFIMFLAIVLDNSIKNRTKFFYSLFLILQTALLGVLCAKDILLFVMFFQLTIIPVWFLLTQWGNKVQKSRGKSLTLVNFASSLLVLSAVLLIHFYNFAINNQMTGLFSFISIEKPQFPIELQMFIYIMLFIGFITPIVTIARYLILNKLFKYPYFIGLFLNILTVCLYGLYQFNYVLFPNIRGF